mmetsp:Transcript_12142/g.33400  ORF Transcript_12142/g.33400 Transcript_12142/m.33400 type:complete len:220 (+) Transcript_12142:168-827(+)
MVKGGGDERGEHGRCQSLLLDGIQTLAQWQEGTAASCDRTAEDRSEHGKIEFAGWNGSAGGLGQLDDDERAHDFVQEHDCRLEHKGQGEDFPQDRETGVQHVRDEDGDGVGIRHKWDGDGVDEDGDHDATAGAGHDHVDEAVGEWCLVADGGKDLATVHEGVSQHAHVFNLIGVHERELSKAIVQDPSAGISGSCVCWLGSSWCLLFTSEYSHGQVGAV